jgi:hypothetical protein
MLRFANTYLTLIVLLASTAANSPLPPDTQKPRTILDYYIMVPHRYLQLQGADSRAARESAISIRDVENGYIQVRQQAGETYTALALFKRPDGAHVVGVETRSCTRGCFSKLTLLLYENDQWIDITSDMLPAIDDGTLREILNHQITAKEENLSGFRPRLLYTLPRGGSAIIMSEHWSGMEVGQFEWEGDKFLFKAVAVPEINNSQTVLASVSNSGGDSLRLIGFNPALPAKLPLKGHLRVSVAYELKSARACLIWVLPVINERRLPDHFTSGSMLHKQGSGLSTGFFGFNNQAHLDQLKVVMADERHQELLTLTYNIDADWQGVTQCPSFTVRCFSNAPDSAIPVGCTVYPSGLEPGQHLTYQWAVSRGGILSGQGTHHIKMDTGGEENVTAVVEVGGLGATCVTDASFASTAATVGRPSKRTDPR